MPTTEKDFKVKNGLQVTNDIVAGGNVIASNPSADNHVATKSYVDSLISETSSSLPVGNTAPSSPNNGDLWFNTEIQRLSIYYNAEWIILSTFADSSNVTNHTHFPEADGGIVDAIFVDAGNVDDPAFQTADGLSASATDWSETFNAGIISV